MAKPKPATQPEHPHAEPVERVVTLIRLLVEAPRQPSVLAREMGYSYRNVARMMDRLEALGLTLEREPGTDEKGRRIAVFYRLPKATVRKVLGV